MCRASAIHTRLRTDPRARALPAETQHPSHRMADALLLRDSRRRTERSRTAPASLALHRERVVLKSNHLHAVTGASKGRLSRVKSYPRRLRHNSRQSRNAGGRRKRGPTASRSTRKNGWGAALRGSRGTAQAARGHFEGPKSTTLLVASLISSTTFRSPM